MRGDVCTQDMKPIYKGNKTEAYKFTGFAKNKLLALKKVMALLEMPSLTWKFNDDKVFIRIMSTYIPGMVAQDKIFITGKAVGCVGGSLTNGIENANFRRHRGIARDNSILYVRYGGITASFRSTVDLFHIPDMLPPTDPPVLHLPFASFFEANNNSSGITVDKRSDPDLNNFIYVSEDLDGIRVHNNTSPFAIARTIGAASGSDRWEVTGYDSDEDFLYVSGRERPSNVLTLKKFNLASPNTFVGSVTVMSTTSTSSLAVKNDRLYLLIRSLQSGDGDMVRIYNKNTLVFIDSFGTRMSASTGADEGALNNPTWIGVLGGQVVITCDEIFAPFAFPARLAFFGKVSPYIFVKDIRSTTLLSGQIDSNPDYGDIITKSIPAKKIWVVQKNTSENAKGVIEICLEGL